MPLYGSTFAENGSSGQVVGTPESDTATRQDTSFNDLTSSAHDHSDTGHLRPDQQDIQHGQSGDGPIEFQHSRDSDEALKDLSERGTTPTHSVRSRKDRHASGSKRSGQEPLDFESSCVVLVAENTIEAQRMNNNYKFGLKKWKSHVTSRPMDVRSEIVQDLYSDISKVKDIKVRTLRPSNVIYAVLFGWWLALLYGLIGVLMFVSVVGIPYAKFCWGFAAYFFWPFGKFVHQVKSFRATFSAKDLNGPAIPDRNGAAISSDVGNETSFLVNKANSTSKDDLGQEDILSLSGKCKEFLSKKESWAWIILGLPLFLSHLIVFAICWFFVVSMPTAKMNSKMLTAILFLPPNEIVIKDSDVNIVRNLDGSMSNHSHIIMYTHQSVNLYYYKYTVDGVNIILANSLVFVVLSIIVGFALDLDPILKCVLGVVSIIPLTYYIGMAITSIAAQSSFAVGALLNATFGSAVEVILLIVMLVQGVDTGKECYQELVKSSLTGAILCSILFIPGISMLVGGLKYRTQKFNPKSASVSSALLFVAVIGIFAPTIFAMLYGQVECTHCYANSEAAGNNSDINQTDNFHCEQCEETLFNAEKSSIYEDHIKPLVYGTCIVLPIAYIIGIIFTMKTHSNFVFTEFEKELEEERGNAAHGSAQWSRMKSVVILFLSAVCIALCGDIISDNIQSFLDSTGISQYFIGVTMLSLVTELPEVINGIQFALQNNVNLGIEIGCSTAVQVCMVQIPLLVLANLIYDMGFVLVFNDIHIFSVVFSVLAINYIFQDGKSDYFQGAVVVSIYVLLMLMYLFMLTPDRVKC